ncbi:MAG TPA: hypothetical protein VFI42_07170 [Thermomicrobiaceae bacterium]|nr:hypothetical protein [Thermomicrobiaceae bacterium]
MGASAVLALLASLLLILPASAAPATIVLQINVTVPLVNQSAMGTFTAQVDPNTLQGPWSFQGTVGGKFAQASGTGAMSGSGSSANLQITSIDMWQMPGMAKPASGAEGGVRMVGDVAYVSFGPIKGVPASISPPISLSPLASGTYIVTNAASGSSEVQSLPMTGAGPVATQAAGPRGWAPLAAGLLAVGLGGAAAGVALSRRRRLPLAA